MTRKTPLTRMVAGKARHTPSRTNFRTDFFDNGRVQTPRLCIYREIFTRMFSFCFVLFCALCGAAAFLCSARARALRALSRHFPLHPPPLESMARQRLLRPRTGQVPWMLLSMFLSLPLCLYVSLSLILPPPLSVLLFPYY